ncbi:ABC transporter ATP-binding protein [Nocardia arthritidis]|uniref:ATP-binding cassette domain-containing protein n=1 Tax=Nocardia arthritidis TaxID=228602 RepID=A0A6G9YQV1_9NOCA|nr:ATP-binding cassette domain-containing protein [Nocardia arthritidis]QIS15685.1 ATP-binding cassette domain-containing protein [Nocardia arthritidis]
MGEIAIDAVPVSRGEISCGPTYTRESVLVDGLAVRCPEGRELLEPQTFRLRAGTVTALTGPSGSGKTTLMRALLGQLPGSATRTGSATVLGHDVFALNPAALQRFRRDNIAYVGQDPGSALNPLMRVHRLLAEVAAHPSRESLFETLELVGLSAEHLRRRPAELSGGQQRRVALARALIRKTPVLILDEPLAGLHGALRTEIARLLTEIATERATTILLSGHDTAAIDAIATDVIHLAAPVARIPSNFEAVGADSIGVPPLSDSSAGAATAEVAIGGSASTEPDARNDAMAPVDARSQGGGADRAVAGKTANCLAKEDASSSKVSSATLVQEPHVGSGSTPGHAECDNAKRVVAANILRTNGISAEFGGRPVLADIAFDLSEGSALAVVGASGAGKTTLARVLAGLHRSAAGTLELRGASFPIGTGSRRPYGGNGIQLVTQNPLSALNPRRTVAQTLGRPLRRIGKVPRRQLARHIAELLGSVELGPEFADRYPGELSGGQRQRISLARALAAEPAVLICDEITSALDGATANAIMALLDRIRAERGTALVVISHDMSLVARHCQRVVVLDDGRIVEAGDTTAVLAAATHRATLELLG